MVQHPVLGIYGKTGCAVEPSPEENHPIVPMQSTARSRLPPLFIPQRKQHVECEPSPCLGSAGTLSPDLQPNTPPTFPHTYQNDCSVLQHQVSKIGRFFLAAPLDTQGHVQLFSAVHMETHQQYVCKVCVLKLSFYKKLLRLYHVQMFLAFATIYRWGDKIHNLSCKQICKCF